MCYQYGSYDVDIFGFLVKPNFAMATLTRRLDEAMSTIPDILCNHSRTADMKALSRLLGDLCGAGLACACAHQGLAGLSLRLSSPPSSMRSPPALSQNKRNIVEQQDLQPAAGQS